MAAQNKTRGYRHQLLSALSENGWTQVSIDTETDGWVDCHWIISSERQNFGTQLVLSFVIDQIWEGPISEAAISCIRASTAKPNDRFDMNNQIAQLQMRKGNYTEKLVLFIEELNRFRNSSQNV